jgi:hypothetical protein
MIATPPGCTTSPGTLTAAATSTICKLLIEIGATVLDPPADYPTYGDGYYAVFFADPMGSSSNSSNCPAGEVRVFRGRQMSGLIRYFLSGLFPAHSMW